MQFDMQRAQARTASVDRFRAPSIAAERTETSEELAKI